MKLCSGRRKSGKTRKTNSQYNGGKTSQLLIIGVSSLHCKLLPCFRFYARFFRHHSPPRSLLCLQGVTFPNFICALSRMEQGIDINKLLQEAKSRWLKALEVFCILQNYARLKITEKTPVRPPSGSLFLFNRRVHRYFRKDGYQWRKKANSKTIREGHERLKVEGNEVLNCYYAHGEHNYSFQRRSYWMLDPAFEHIALVHYREVTEGRGISEQILNNSPDSYPALLQSVTVSDDRTQGFQFREIEFYEKWQNSSSSGSGEEVTSNQSINMQVTVTLKKLEEQLSLEKYDKSEEILGIIEESLELPLDRDSSLGVHDLHDEFESIDWNEEQVRLEDMLNGSDDSMWCNESPSSLHDASKIDTREANSQLVVLCSDNVPISENGVNFAPDFPDLWLHQDQFATAAEVNSESAAPQGNLFCVWEFSPEWAFTSEITKVIITSDYICNPSEQWTILFGDVEVPLELVRNGVFRCMTPHHSVGKVKVRLTSGENGPCVEIGEFEFREKSDAPVSNRIPQVNEDKSSEELLLLVALVKLLLCKKFEASIPQVTCNSSLSMEFEENEDAFSTVVDALLSGTATAIQTLDFLVQELLKDKLQQSSINFKKVEMDDILINQQNSVIHLISGLGYQWALGLILCSGIGVNFRDSKGWTALHWAAKYGREEMVAALLAAGASAGAVTHPNPENPTGKTAASIASENGHKGLAGYLSEFDLTSHPIVLKSEKAISLQCSTSVKEDKYVDRISKRISHLWSGTEDQLSLRDTLAAVRNTTQAAATIQAAFRAYSFKKKQERALASQLNRDISSEDISELPIVSKLHNARYLDHGPKFDKEAVSIQKNYRCWSRRKEFLYLRKNVVKIQAHWRAHLVRKKYMEVLKSVSFVEKAILRWHRKGNGLRGFQGNLEFSDADKHDEDDILKVFRQKKVDSALDVAISSVSLMVDSPEAQQQYRRMLGKYQHAEIAYSQYRARTED